MADELLEERNLSKIYKGSFLRVLYSGLMNCLKKGTFKDPFGFDQLAQFRSRRCAFGVRLLLGFRVRGLGFGVQGFGFRVQGFGFSV